MLYFLIFIFGLAIGSFLNVVICRLKTNESILIGRSYCPKCKTILKWYDLIPVFSFIFCKGRCRYCDKKIIWQYPMVEIITGLLFLLIFNFQFSLPAGEAGIFNLIYYLIIISFLIVIFVYDLKHYLILDKIVFPAVIITIIFNFFLLPEGWQSSILSAFGASLFFLSLVLISKGEWMGLGDVKFAFLMGLILSWPNILLALFLSFFSGAIVGITLILFGKKGFKSQIPFGPFLSGSTILIIIYGEYIIELYQNMFWFF